MRTYDEAYAAARDEAAFSNGTEGDAWMGAWCERCVHDIDDGPGCPLVLVAYMGRTPAEWFEQDHSEGWSLTDAYHCAEFRSRDDPGPGYEPQPDPPLPGQLELFDAEPYTGTRMFVQPVTEGANR